MRTVVHLMTDYPELELVGLELPPEAQALRIVAVGPRTGGASLRQLRAVLGELGRVRLSGTPNRIYADVDEGPPMGAPLVALGMIARSDAAGLERAILSALPYVDEIVIGIDGRSDEETRAVAEAYADTVYTFDAGALDLPPAQWETDGMDFARARNLGRDLTRAPWTLVIDTDEFIRHGRDFRAALASAAEDVGAFDVTVCEGAKRHTNGQRLARTEFRWWSPVHNQLGVRGRSDAVALEVMHDQSLRPEQERARRCAQRNANIEQLRGAAEAGEVNSLYHLAKHYLGQGDERGVQLAEDYRFRLGIGGPLRDHRAELAFSAACLYYNRDDLDRAALWATRTLLDGPRAEAFCLHGDIAEDRGDLRTALAWYEAACAVPDDGGTFRWHQVTSLREGRRAGLRLALGLPLPVAAA